MKENKAIDDLIGIAGSLAGLANDARNGLHEKGEKIKTSLSAADDIQALRDRLDVIEARLTALEQKQEQ